MPYADPLDERARASRRKHYHAHKAQYLERNRQTKAAKLAFIREVKSDPCVDCDASYPHYVMDFDHRDPAGKTGVVANLVNWGWKRLVTEVMKCDVVCANCHRERTHGMLSSASP